MQTRSCSSADWNLVKMCVFLSVFSVLQAIRMLIMASTDLQKEIVEGGRVSHCSKFKKMPAFFFFTFFFKDQLLF